MKRGMPAFVLMLMLLLSCTADEPAIRPQTSEPISFATSDGGLVHADAQGTGERGVVLRHGGRFNKESWAPQARALASAWFRVLAIDFRGYGESRGPGHSDPLSAPLHQDVLAALRQLRTTGARTVSVIGGSRGAKAAADASIAAGRAEIERIVLLAGSPSDPLEELEGRKLFIICREDPGPGDRPRLPDFQANYERTPQPKEIIVLEGSAHAQHMFQTDQGERVLREILRFLSAP